MVVKLVVTGAAGRMGTAIVNLAQQDKDFQITARLEAIAKQNLSVGLTGDISPIQMADVVINFATPEGTVAGYFPSMEKYKTPWVIGTTGFNEHQEASIEKFSKRIPIVKSSNMSLGVNVFFKVAQQAAKALPDYEVHIQEAHHVHKKDSPSGTAKQVGALIREITGRSPIYDEPIREGEIVGDHRVIFKGAMDQIELFHHAESRDIFAAGALLAAKWIVKQKPGRLYTMQDVLGLK
jgi:4-hydroxy-tetrahydrodipicolinate reductase